MTEYQKYQLQWMIDHDKSLDDLIGELTECEFYRNSYDTLQDLYESWEHDCGFGAEGIWASLSEWEDCEAKELPDMNVTVGQVIDNPAFMFDVWFEITTTDDDGTVYTLYDSHDDIGKEIPAELLIEPITYMVVNTAKGRLRIEVR